MHINFQDIAEEIRGGRIAPSKFLGFYLDLWRSPEVTNIFNIWKPYINSYLSSIDTFSLSRTVFQDIRLQSF